MALQKFVDFISHRGSRGCIEFSRQPEPRDLSFD
jgi:hypothetical protein